ncbi:hypothetical protein [Methanobrevibacter sp.]|uniref:hypothetical protein n=1 Tax=Methanobrevibacter sp. TaxID=66852 RepID=UPI00388DDF88
MNFKMILTLLVIGFLFATSSVVAQDVNTNNDSDNNPNDIIKVPTHYSPNKYTNHDYNYSKNNFTIDSFILNGILNLTNIFKSNGFIIHL